MPSWGCQLQGCSQSRHGREIRFASQCLVKQILAGCLGGTSKTTCNRNWFKKITGYYRNFINSWRAWTLFRTLCALRTATWPCSAAKCAADKPNKRSVLSAANWLTYQASNLGLNAASYNVNIFSTSAVFQESNFKFSIKSQQRRKEISVFPPCLSAPFQHLLGMQLEANLQAANALPGWTSYDKLGSMPTMRILKAPKPTSPSCRNHCRNHMI